MATCSYFSGNVMNGKMQRVSAQNKEHKRYILVSISKQEYSSPLTPRERFYYVIYVTVDQLDSLNYLTIITKTHQLLILQ